MGTTATYIWRTQYLTSHVKKCIWGQLQHTFDGPSIWQVTWRNVYGDNCNIHLTDPVFDKSREEMYMGTTATYIWRTQYLTSWRNVYGDNCNKHLIDPVWQSEYTCGDNCNIHLMNGSIWQAEDTYRETATYIWWTAVFDKLKTIWGQLQHTFWWTAVFDKLKTHIMGTAATWYFSVTFVCFIA